MRSIATSLSVVLILALGSTSVHAEAKAKAKPAAKGKKAIPTDAELDAAADARAMAAFDAAGTKNGTTDEETSDESEETASPEPVAPPPPVKRPKAKAAVAVDEGTATPVSAAAKGKSKLKARSKAAAAKAAAAAAAAAEGADEAPAAGAADAPASTAPAAGTVAAPDAGAAAVPAAAPGDPNDPAGDAAAVAQMLAMSSGDAPVSSGPPAALARKLVPVLVAINLRLKVEPPLKMQELQYFGGADVDGDGQSELIISWARGRDMGGVALARKAETEHKVLAIADVKEPVLRVQAIPLAGDKSRHLLVRSGTSLPGGGSQRRMAVWGAQAGALRKIWEQHDTDRIENNPDISTDREARLSDVTFKEGAAGKTGTLTVAVTEYRAPKGKGPEATETRGARTLHYEFDKKRGVLVLKSKEDATPEQLRKDEMGMAGPGASGLVPSDEPEKTAGAKASDDIPVNQRDNTSEEVVNATGLRAREQMSRIDLPASPGERMQRMEAAYKKRADDNRKRRVKMNDAEKKKDEAEEAAETTESSGEESGARPTGVDAVDGAK